MKRTPVSWSNFTDRVEGPCLVCGQIVQIVIPHERPAPALMHHATCDPMTALRANLKTATPAPLPPEETIRFKTPAGQ